MRIHILNMIIQHSNSVVAFSVVAAVIVYVVDALMLVCDEIHSTPLGSDLYRDYPGNLEALDLHVSLCKGKISKVFISMPHS